MNVAEDIPEVDEVVEIGNFQFKILQVSSTKIDVVQLLVEEED